MRRRSFLQFLLTATLPLSLFKRQSFAVASGSSRAAAQLTRLGSPWSCVEIEFTKKIKTHRGMQPSTFPGYIIRLPDATGRQRGLKESLYAVSRICPHEGCPIKFYHQRSEVPHLLEMGDFPNPMLVCTCHQSVFDPAQAGKVLSGPAPRPPWTFDFVIEKGRIIIKDLEPGGEKWG